MARYRYIIALLIIAALIAGAVAYKIYNKPHRDIAGEKAEYTLTADELFDEYELDEASANGKFLDAVLQVTGSIATLEENGEGRQVLILSAQNALLGGVSATLTETSEALSLSEGQEVTVKCRCTGKLMDVVLVDCSLAGK